MRPLLEQALHVTPETRKTFLKNLTASQREALQAQMTARQQELGITPTPKPAAPSAPKLDEDRYNSIRSGALIGSQRAIKVGRHLVMIPAAAKYKRTRDTLCYVYHRGILTGYAARGAKLVKLNMDHATKAHVLRSLFNVKT